MRDAVQKDVPYQQMTTLMKNDFSTLKDLNLVLINSLEPECDSCKMRLPILQKVKGILGSRIEIFNLDEVLFKEFSKKYKLQSFSSLALLANGNVIWETSVVSSKDELIHIITTHN
jgi:thiol-disulfide isomerase/thioredoxin